MAKAFDEADVEAWREALHEHRPTSLANVDASRLPQIAGVALSAYPSGMVVRLCAADGTELTFAANPVAARILAVAIIGEGQGAGWLDRNVEVTAPDLPGEH